MQNLVRAFCVNIAVFRRFSIASYSEVCLDLFLLRAKSPHMNPNSTVTISFVFFSTLQMFQNAKLIERMWTKKERKMIARRIWPDFFQVIFVDWLFLNEFIH